MGTKYSSVSISGYNVSPPADDGSRVASNVLEWDKHISKIGDPIKTLAEAINTALVTHFDIGPDKKTTNYSVATSDYQKIIEMDGASLTATLPAAASAGAGFHVTLKNLNSTALTVNVSGAGTIDGATSVSIAQNGAKTFIVNNGATEYEEIGSTDAFTSMFAANDEWLARMATTPAGFTVSAVNDKALRIVSGTPGADGGSNAFSTALNSAVTSSTGGAHTHGDTFATANFNSSLIGGTVPGSSSYIINASAHNHTITGSVQSGGSHSHTTNVNVQYRDFNILVKS